MAAMLWSLIQAMLMKMRSVFYWEENYFWGKMLDSQRKLPQFKRKVWAQESCSCNRQ